VFGKWKYQNKVNDEIVAAAERVYGRSTGALDTLGYCVDGKAIGNAVDASYKKDPPIFAALVAVAAQAEICLKTGDLIGIEKWANILQELDAREEELDSK
jgi:hypothetical protein